jgi:hypothetical protein
MEKKLLKKYCEFNQIMGKVIFLFGYYAFCLHQQMPKQGTTGEIASYLEMMENLPMTQKATH